MLLAASSLACTEPPSPGAAEAPLVYGTDGRTPQYAHSNAALRARTRESTVALINSLRLDRNDPDDITFYGQTLGDRLNLCADERFRDEQAVAFCSGTLIDHDLVLTAGHCVETQEDCEDASFVFNFYETADGVLETITSEDVYGCRALLVQRFDTPSSFFSVAHDYAVIQLDRPARHIAPDGRATYRDFPPVQATDVPVTFASSTAAIGFPEGISAKIEDTGIVVYPRDVLLDYFGTTNDLFGGNSGSGVYDATGTLIGIAVRADPGYVPRFDGACFVTRTVAGVGYGGALATESTYVRRAIDALCATGHPTALCGTLPLCGDGTCSGTETPTSCAFDCDAPACGDGVCHPSEYGTCLDCISFSFDPDPPPAGWTCPIGLYDTGEACDCNCGAPDPDCEVRDWPAVGCERNEMCSAAGACVPDPDAPVLPEGWTCFGTWYDHDDGCHCGCGAPDPDCDDPGAEVFLCGEGETCADAECVPAASDVDAAVPTTDAGGAGPGDAGVVAPDGGTLDAPPAEDAGGCAARPGRTAPGPLAMLVVALVGLAVKRRRR